MSIFRRYSDGEVYGLDEDGHVKELSPGDEPVYSCITRVIHCMPGPLRFILEPNIRIPSRVDRVISAIFDGPLPRFPKDKRCVMVVHDIETYVDSSWEYEDTSDTAEGVSSFKGKRKKDVSMDDRQSRIAEGENAQSIVPLEVIRYLLRIGYTKW